MLYEALLEAMLKDFCKKKFSPKEKNYLFDMISCLNIFFGGMAGSHWENIYGFFSSAQAKLNSISWEWVYRNGRSNESKAFFIQ